jgi:DNA-binding beta-propeller fold protein YncE
VRICQPISNPRLGRASAFLTVLLWHLCNTTPAGAAPAYGLSFNGTSAYVETSTGVIPSSGDFTVEFWAACPTAPSTYKEILSQGRDGTALYIGTDTANNIQLGDTWAATGVAFPVGGWHHFAVVKSSANTIFYLDGTNWLARGWAIANPVPPTGLRFGRQFDDYAGDYAGYWPGSIGDVRVWNRVLSAAEISASLTNQLTGSEANLVANWQFKEGTGTTCTSIGPAPVVGTLINGPVWIVPPVFVLGTTNLTEGPVAGSDSVVLGVSQAGGTWTATANDSWLHVTTASGVGSTNVLFTFDANAGPTRTGTLTIAGQTLAITQASAGFVLASSLTTLVSSNSMTPLNMPFGVAVDKAGNVYIADAANSAIKKWNPAGHSVTTLADSSSGLYSPTGVAVDGAGNVYIADMGISEVKKWNVANSNLTTLVSSGLYEPHGVAVDAAGNVYIADTYNSAVKKWNVASSNVTTLADSSSGLLGPGGVAVDAAGNVYIADTYNLAVKKWNVANSNLTTLVSSGLNYPVGVAVDGAGDVYVADTINNAIEELPRIFANPTAFTAEVAGPAADTNSIMLSVCPANAHWLATASDSWLHVTTPSGTGSTNVLFSLDANPGGTRTGSLTIAGQTLTITQAGAAYVLANPLTTLADSSSGLGDPSGVAVDGAGNVYIADSGNGAVEKWNAANNSVTTLTDYSSSGIWNPQGVAVDGAGNVYIADYGNLAVKKWNAASGTVSTLVPSGPWVTCVAVDGAGNVYFADILYGMVEKWNAASNSVTTLVSSGLSYPTGVAVDGAGNVYIADYGNNAIKEWNAANNSVTTLVSSELNQPTGVAVDGAGNVYIADYGNNAIEELPRAFVNPAPVTEGAAAGSDSLPVVLPDTQNLSGPFAPGSDQSWLIISGVTNGVVSFSFTANTTTAPRTANITLLGQTIPITQSAVPLPPTIANWSFNGSNQFQLQFTGSSNSTYTVFSTTNVALPLSNWVPLNPVIETSPGQYQFTDTNAPSDPQRFYAVRSL